MVQIFQCLPARRHLILRRKEIYWSRGGPSNAERGMGYICRVRKKKRERCKKKEKNDMMRCEERRTIE